MQASRVFHTKTGKNITLWTWLCAQEHCHVETGKEQTQTGGTKLNIV